MKRITDSNLETIAGRINRELGTPLVPYRNEDGKLLPNINCYHVEHVNGRVSLVRMCDNGATSRVIDATTKRGLYNEMFAFIAGIHAYAAKPVPPPIAKPATLNRREAFAYLDGFVDDMEALESLWRHWNGDVAHSATDAASLEQWLCEHIENAADAGLDVRLNESRSDMDDTGLTVRPGDAPI